MASNQPRRNLPALPGKAEEPKVEVPWLSIAGPVPLLRKMVLETRPVSSSAYPFLCSVRPSQ
jgi:hypothetical protein